MIPTRLHTATDEAVPTDGGIRPVVDRAAGIDPGGVVAVEPLNLRRPSERALPHHAFTVDVEDWYQSCVDYDARITERVLVNVDRILALLEDCGVKGSFFIQGRVAEAFPGMVATMVSLGHEVQSHGYSHRPLFEMDARALRNELERAKRTVEDAAGVPVTAFRAQDFSIAASNLWALETLHDVGFEIDSSIFPMKRPRYGIRGWPLAPHHILLREGRRLLEIPVAIWASGRFRLPVAGGGYFRVLPRGVIERGLRGIEQSGRPAILYCHPYEFNTDELNDYRSIPTRLRMSQGMGRRWFPDRVRALLGAGSFGRFTDVLRAWGLPCESPS